MVPESIPGSKKEPFGVTLGSVLKVFGMNFCIVFDTTRNAFLFKIVVASACIFEYRL